MALLMFGSCVLHNHMWPWGKACDLRGCLGSGAPRAGSEKQNDGAWRRGDGYLVLSGRDSLGRLFIHSFIHKCLLPGPELGSNDSSSV